MEEGICRDDDKDGRCDGSEDFATLQGYEYRFATVGVGLSAPGMPMMGQKAINFAEKKVNWLMNQEQADNLTWSIYGDYFEIFFNYYHGRDLTLYL